MTTDQRLERIDKTLLDILEMLKIDNQLRQMEHPEPEPEPHPDSDPHRLTGYRGNWPDMHPYSSAKPPPGHRNDSTAPESP